ncbi:MAG TPA: hypothetical protein VMX16_02585 [Terriglobia bacterium]|nr:hypothetical protein [Terriglobia bacterium]
MNSISSPFSAAQALGVLAQGFAPRLCPQSVVEDADVMGVKIARHPLGITQPRQGALKQHTVVSGSRPGNLLAVTFGQHL